MFLIKLSNTCSYWWTAKRGNKSYQATSRRQAYLSIRWEIKQFGSPQVKICALKTTTTTTKIPRDRPGTYLYLLSLDGRQKISNGFYGQYRCNCILFALQTLFWSNRVRQQSAQGSSHLQILLKIWIQLWLCSVTRFCFVFFSFLTLPVP